MGGVNGMLCINKQLPDEPTAPPILELADVSVGGERMNTQMSTGRRLKVEEQSKPITIKIIAHDKDIFRKPMYRYTLRGMEGQVIYSYQPELTLSGLSARTYQVMASCSTRTGGWSEDYQILELVVLPPWYKSIWFISVCFILIVSGIILAFFSLLRRKENKLKWAMKEHEQQVYEEKVRFLININHELRTPLTLIHAPLKQLLKSLSPEDDKYPVIQSISKQSGRMKNLLNMVLDVRKMEVGQSTLHAETVELAPWIEQLVADFRPEAQLKGISILYNPEPAVDTLCFDKEKCTTILINLLINALKYSPENSLIHVATSLSDDKSRVRISVSDEGPGLKDVDINNLFIRFYQGNNSRPGTGIGLSYSKILAEQHGGSIGAYDHGNMSGSTFWFELPRDIQPGKMTLQPQAYLNELLAPTQEVESIPDDMQKKEDTQSCTLLIVDDNKDLTDYLSSALKGKFKEIRVAYDGEEALRICHESSPDIIVSDIQMPRMNGYELCKHIKEDLAISHIPVILLTAKTDENDHTEGYLRGADAYITKPFNAKNLELLVQNIQKSRKQNIEHFKQAEELNIKQITNNTRDEVFMKELVELIMANLTKEDFGVTEITAHLRISRSLLHMKLKSLTGCSITQFIRTIKMKEAKTHLLNGMNVSEASFAVGISDPNYFTKCFKKEFNITPTEFLKQLK